MPEKKLTIESSGIRYGIYLFVSLVAFFLLMKLLGLAEIVGLRYFNFLILLVVLYLALSEYKKKSNGVMTYFRGLGLGVVTSLVGAIPFAVFIGIYLGVLDPGLMETIRDQWSAYATYINPFSLSFVVALEGAISGFLTSYVLLQYLRTSHMENPTE